MNKTAHTALFPLLLLCLGGCQTQAPSLSTASAARLIALAGPASHAGAETLIYRGDVTATGEQSASFSYERRVSGGAEIWTSTHITRRSTSDRPLVYQRAAHTADYAFLGFEEIHAQTGVTSRIQVTEAGGLLFEREDASGIRRTEEGSGAPVVVGPTLFGFVLRHWAQLERGKVVPVRFAAADQGQSFAFDLKRAPSERPAAGGAATEMVIRFEPTSFFLGLFVEPMELVFDRESKRILSYRGLIPPRGDEQVTLTASVEYHHVSAVFR